MQEVVKDLGLTANISKEEDILRIMEYGIMRTPGLVINDKVVISGRVPAKKEIEKLLTQNQ